MVQYINSLDIERADDSAKPGDRYTLRCDMGGELAFRFVEGAYEKDGDRSEQEDEDDRRVDLGYRLHHAFPP